MSNIHEKIREFRKQKGINQKQVADSAGLSVAAYSNIESGISKSITIVAGKGIAKALGVSFAELFDIEVVGTTTSEAAGELEQLRVRIGELEDKNFKLQTDINQRDSHIATLVQYKDILKYKLIEMIYKDYLIALSSYQQRLGNAKDDKEKDYYECKIEQENTNRENKINKLIKSGFFTKEDVDYWRTDFPAFPDSDIELSEIEK
jgi:transcriptional regulator with XRE-family HTH domain